MIEQPERYIERFAKCGADGITVHAEATKHLHRVIQQIKDCGLRAGVALNPATPLSTLDYVLGRCGYGAFDDCQSGIWRTEIYSSDDRENIHTSPDIADEGA